MFKIEKTTDKSIMSVKLDWTFKELMLKEEIRNRFIEAVLKVKIKSSVILNTFLRKDYFDDKLGILDVRVMIEDKTQIDIEIQVIPFKQWAERTLFYTSKIYVEQINQGEEYKVLNKCINISILDFTYLDEEEFFNTFHIRNDKTNKLYTDKMGFYILESPKIPKEVENINDLVLWCKFIDASSEEEMKMLATQNESINVAYEELKRLSQDEQKRAEYEARQKAIRDYNSLVYQFKEEGFLEGEQKGKLEGIKESKLEIAKNLLKMELPLDKIINATGLSEETINQLKKEI